MYCTTRQCLYTDYTPADYCYSVRYLYFILRILLLIYYFIAIIFQIGLNNNTSVYVLSVMVVNQNFVKYVPLIWIVIQY